MAGNERFNNEAANWDKNPSVQEATRLAFETLKPILKAEQHVLEVGCGTGLLTLRVAPLVHSIVAVDPAHGMIEALNTKISSTSVENVTSVCQLLEDPEDPALPQDSETGKRQKFDLVLSHLVMHHVPDLRLFLGTLLGCLKPGGRVALTDFEDWGPQAIKFHPPAKLEGVERHGIPRKWIEDLMREVGFADVKVWVGWTLDKKVDEWEDNQPGDTLPFPFLVCEGVKL
ncbi:putative methyltransferase [Aspergillus unguis]